MSDNTTAHATDDDSAGGRAAPPRSTSPEVPQQEVDKSTKTDPPNLSDNNISKKETLPQTTAETPAGDTSAHGIRSLVSPPDQENHNSKKDSVPSSVPQRLDISNMASDLDDGLPTSSGNLQMSMALKVEMEKTQASPTMKVSNRASCHIFLRR